MECNKDEAIRAKELSEEKMRNGDFEGAQRFALKAQKLFPDLENVSQILTVCSVHCSEKKKLNGLEKDWYGILQVERFADETTIKKQYRKLALLLHPDKNKFPGAESAFKLIGEANMFLTDQAKRSQYDMKCRCMMRNHATRPQSHQSYSSTSVNNRNPIPEPDGDSKTQEKVKVHSNVKDGIKGVSSTSVANSNPIPVPDGGFKTQEKVKGHSNERDGKKGVRMAKPAANKPSKVATSVNANGKRGRRSVKESSESYEASSGDDIEDEVNIEDEVEDKSVQGNCDNGVEKHPTINGGHQVRRSSRLKQHVSYREGLSDDDITSAPPKRSKSSRQLGANAEEKREAAADSGASKDDNSIASSAGMRVCMEGVEQNVSTHLEESLPSEKRKTGEFRTNEEEPRISGHNDMISQSDGGSELNTNTVQSPQVFEFPDTEFYDFDKDKAMNLFAVGQVWAIYDMLDGMPRFYAEVRKVSSPGFKLLITWLEPHPHNKKELGWCDVGLPVSCGEYCMGSSEETSDYLMFSHLVHHIERRGKHSYLVYPRKGEIWALFRDWDINWSSNPENHKSPYQYDLVEVVSDYNERIGIEVSYLGKVRGFVSLFRQTVKDGITSFLISPSERYRFSHKIPSYRLTSKERGAPVGSLELDPAALPTHIDGWVDFVGTELGSGSLGNEVTGLHLKSPQNPADPTIGFESNQKVKNSQKNDFKRESSVIKLDDSEDSSNSNPMGPKGSDNSTDANLMRPKGSDNSRKHAGKTSTRKKYEKNDLATGCLKPRRSPRGLSKKN